MIRIKMSKKDPQKGDNEKKLRNNDLGESQEYNRE